MKRSIEIAVISDVHLGTYGCHAEQLLQYLRHIQPKILVINGDFIDTWQFRKKYFPIEHMEVINQVMKMSVLGTKVYYITGNHDDVLRRFSDSVAGNIYLMDKLVLNIAGKNYWIFHGDIFDFSIIETPWLAKMGGKGYDLLIRINRRINKWRKLLGKGEWSFASEVKNGFKRALKFISDFEKKAIEIAAEKGYDGVICGHIHIPVIRNEKVGEKTIVYMNSGDWIENLTSLEFNFGHWRLHKYDVNDYLIINKRLKVPRKDINKIKVDHHVYV